jgi:hypothetical protein
VKLDGEMTKEGLQAIQKIRAKHPHLDVWSSVTLAYWKRSRNHLGAVDGTVVDLMLRSLHALLEGLCRLVGCLAEMPEQCETMSLRALARSTATTSSIPLRSASLATGSPSISFFIQSVKFVPPTPHREDRVRTHFTRYVIGSYARIDFRPFIKADTFPWSPRD